MDWREEWVAGDERDKGAKKDGESRERGHWLGAWERRKKSVVVFRECFLWKKSGNALSKKLMDSFRWSIL
jgi:hypothetical protein